MLEVGREEVGGEVGRIPDDEAIHGRTPRDDVVGGGVVHHLVRLEEERSRATGAAAVLTGFRFHPSFRPLPGWWRWLVKTREGGSGLCWCELEKLLLHPIY